MAMFLFPHNGLVLLLIGYILVLIQNGLNTNTITVDAARGNVPIEAEFIQIQKPPVKRLLISKPHVSHYLPCAASIHQGIDEAFISVESFNYTWFRNGKELQTYTSRRGDFQLLPNGTLRLPTNEKATGVYQCLVNATDKGLHALLSESCSVDYPVFKRIQTKLNITATVGNSLTLSCPVTSVPSANISWMFRNTSIEKRLKESRFTILTNGSLVLKNVTDNDRGMYKCIAQNAYAAKTHRHILITVHVISSKTRSSLSTASLEYKLLPPLQDDVHYIPSSTDLQLRCLGNSNNIIIEWWFRKSLNAQPQKLSNNSVSYYISQATVEHDDGYYMCTTKNDSQIFQVIVTVPPSFTKTLKSYDTALAAFVNFSCSAKGNPQPEFTWYRNGRLLNGESYTINIRKNILTIQSFDIFDEGIYQCFAKNIAGETYSAALLQLPSSNNSINMPKTLKNVRCYALNFNTINVTFSSSSKSSYFISVHFAQKTPYVWESKPPQQVNNTDYVIISGHMPTYKPFVILTRTLISMLSLPHNKDINETTMKISPLSVPAFCCTQGLPIHAFHVSADVIITWANQPLKTKYFIVQFSTAFTRPHPKDFFENSNVQGISSSVVIRNDHEDIKNHLQDVIPLTESQARDVLSKTQSIRNDSDDYDADEDVFSLVVPSNVTGILLKKCIRAKIRILVVTNETENLKQDFRYVQWKIIENNTEEALVRVSHLGSRSITYVFKDTFEDDCVQVCNFVYDMPDTGYSNRNFCHDKALISSKISLSGLKPTKNYKTQFYSCGSVHNLLAEIDVRTLPDPPGTITNQKITKQNGLKLSWNPPTNPNGKIYHYNILWTVNNVTHEANVSSSETYFKFPNITEREKINITVRVFGENGLSAPIYIDLRNVRHEHLEIERTSLMDTYWGIAIGAALSFLCVLIFSLVCIYQRHRFKMHSGQTQLSSQSESNIGAVSTPGVGGGTETTGLGRFLGDSGGGLGESGTLSEYHEMQTLIPKSQDFQIVTDIPSHAMPKQLPNGNGNCPRRDDIPDYISAETPLDEEPIALCSSTPLAPRQPSINGDVGNDDTLYFIPMATKSLRRDIAADFPPPPPASHSSRFALSKISSSPNFFNSGTSSVSGGCRPLALTEDCSRQRHTNRHSQWQPAMLQNGCSHYVNTANNRNSYSSSSNNSKIQLPPPIQTPSHQSNHSADNGLAPLSEPQSYGFNSGHDTAGGSTHQLFPQDSPRLSGTSPQLQLTNNPSLDRNDGNLRITTLTPIANNNNTLSWHNKQAPPADQTVEQILHLRNSSTAPLIDNNSTIGSEAFSSPSTMAAAVSDSHPSVSGYSSSTSSHHSNPPNHHNQEADNSSNPLLKTNWNHRRPNVDPNG